MDNAEYVFKPYFNVMNTVAWNGTSKILSVNTDAVKANKY